MADESYSFSTARTRLEAIVTQVRKKDTSLEKSLDLLEEGVRLANACTEQIDRADWVTPESMADSEVVPGEVPAEEAGDAAEAVARDYSGDAALAADSAEADAAPADDPADDAWADDGAPADEHGVDDDPSAVER